MNKPQIGLSMLCHLSEPFTKMTNCLTKADTQYIEIVDDGFHELNSRRIKTLAEIGKSCSLKYSVHAPFSDVNPASPSKPMLNAMLKRLKKSIEYACAIDAIVWVFHPGVKTGISSFYPGTDWLQNIRSAEALFEIANDCGVKIAIENVPEPYPFLMKSVEDFGRFYAEVDADIGLVLDVGHANINGQTELFLTVFRDKIVHVHVSDNDGKSDQHLGLGCGTVDWERVASLLRKNRFDNVVVVESIEHVEESVQKLRQLFP